MIVFDPDKFREAIYKAKLLIAITRSTDPEKQRKLDRMNSLIDEILELCEEILGK